MESSSGYLQPPKPNPQVFKIDSFTLRKSDLDDCDALMQIITDSELDGLNQLYDYPKLISLYEQHYLSLTILDEKQRIIGCAVFNDFPQGLTGKIDFLHENFWEYWLYQAFDFEEQDVGRVASYNSLFMTFLYMNLSVNELDQSEEMHLVEKIFQHVYGTLPRVQSILFLHRGEAFYNKNSQQQITNTLTTMFQEINCKDRQALSRVMGINPQSKLLISGRDRACDFVEIRMAKEEDHDDLADVFNQQSEVLTQQFGEYFIADLIATQNQTRINTLGRDNKGKALVSEVGGKAVGLMSLSAEIDYKLLAQNYELDLFDNLLKSEFMNELREHRLNVRDEQKWHEQEIELERMERLYEDLMQCKVIGQRMCLQQFCVENEADIRMQLEQFIQTANENQEKAKSFTKEFVASKIDEWMKKFKFNQPSKLYAEMNCQDHEVLCMIQSVRNFFLETLVFFGLPKGYMQQEGHWKDWEKKILEERKAEQLKLHMKKKKQLQTKKKTEKKDDLKPPSYFDFQPLLDAFSKFCACTAENRTLFTSEVEANQKQFINLFTNENGELIQSRCMDLNQMGLELMKYGIQVPVQIQDLLSCMLECFGNAKPQEKIIQVMPKREEETKDQGNKSKGQSIVQKKLAELAEAPKPIDVVQKMVSYEEYKSAANVMKEYEVVMCRLGFTKGQILEEIVKGLEEEKKNRKEKLNQERRMKLNVVRNQQVYEIIKDFSDTEGIPDVPEKWQNAIVINMFCIDEKYESRSEDFLYYAFQLFPEKDYIILSQPHTIPEQILLQNFILVQKKRESNFEHVLYIIHKDSLLANQLKVRRSIIQDMNEIESYMDDIGDKDTIKKDMVEAIKENASKKMAFSVYCSDVLIGMYVISKNVNLDYYVSHFCIQDHIILKEHSKDYHGRLLHAILNPLFSKCSRFILKEILRLCNKTCLYFEVISNYFYFILKTHTRTQLPEIFNELYLVRARRFPYFLKRKWDFVHEKEFLEKMGDRTDVQDGSRDPFDQEESNFSLSIITKKDLSLKKTNNNARIVVVGASDTGISLIESLLTIKDVRFPFLTLLAPGGLVTMNAEHEFELLKSFSTSYTFSEIRNLMLDARVTLLDAKIMTLDKKGKTIGLDKNSVLPFDIMISCVGLIDTTLQDLDLVSTGVYTKSQYKGYVDKICKLGVYSIDDPYLYQDFSVTGKKNSNIQLLQRKKKPQCVTIYGRNLNIFCFINGLLNRGVEGNRINLIIPARDKQIKTEFESNQEVMDQENDIISDPNAFYDEVIEAKVIENLEKKGIKVYQNYSLFSVDTDAKGYCEKVQLTKPYNEEFEKRLKELKQKQQQVQENQKLQHGVNQFMDRKSSQFLDEDQGFFDIELESYEQKEVVMSRFFVTSGKIDIDREIFNIIHENGLVYNGRLIIKNNFQTTEDAIFACGKICEFSQIYKHKAVGTSLRLDKYNGRELGQKMAKSLLEALDLGYLINQKVTAPDDLPTFYMPVGIGGILPSNFRYYYIKRPDWYKPKVCWGKQKNREPIISNNIVEDNGQYIKFNFDNNGIIDTITYLGYEEISVPSLISFVGLSEKYLNQLPVRFQNGLIPNISEFLSENWAIGLYHEWFSEFRHLIKNDLVQVEQIQKMLKDVTKHARKGNYLDSTYYEEMKKSLTPEIAKLIKDATLDFIRENQNHLPMYYLPLKKIESN